MKKLIYLFVALAISLTALPAKAQTKLGVKAGLNLVSNALDAAKDPGIIENKDSYNGFMIGPTLEAMIPLSPIGIDLSVLFSQKGVAFKDFGKATISYLEVPLNLKYKIGIPKLASVYAAAGPYVSYGFPGKLTDQIKSIDINKLDVGGNVGLGVEVLSKLQVGANYSFGFSKNVVEIQQGINLSEINYKNGLWSLTATYFF